VKSPSLPRDFSPWRTAGAVALALLALAPAVYRLTAGAQQAADADVVIRYMAWGAPQQLAVEQQIIDDFNAKMAAEGRSVRVRLFMPPAGGYEQKLRMMLASGTAPDVLRADQYYFPSMAPKGYFRDLTDLAAGDPEFDPADFHPAAMRENYCNGRLYGLNVMFGPVICYFNRDLFVRAGLPDPHELWKRGEWTWDKFEECAQALTTPDGPGKVYGFLIPGGSGGVPVWAWALWVWSEGGEILSPRKDRCLLDSPQAIAGLTRLQALRFVKKVSPTQADAAASAFTFESGNIAMEFSWAGNAPRFRDSIRDFAWDIAPTPARVEVRDGRKVVVPYAEVKGNQLVMAANCKHPAEAWEWIKFMCSPRTEMRLYGDQMRRNVPTRLSVLRSAEYLKTTRPPFNIDTIPFSLDHARELPIDYTWPRWTIEAQQFIDQLFTAPPRSPQVVMPRCAAAVNRVLADERRRFARYLQGGQDGR